jgi:hypothetical protein
MESSAAIIHRSAVERNGPTECRSIIDYRMWQKEFLRCCTRVDHVIKLWIYIVTYITSKMSRTDHDDNGDDENDVGALAEMVVMRS